MEGDTTISSLEQSLRSDTDSTSSKTPKFFSYIESHYGQLTRNHLKNWTSNNRRLAESTSKRQFLLACRSNDVFSQHLLNFYKRQKNVHFYSNSGKKDFYNSNKHYLKKLLKTEIRDIHINIEFIKKSFERIKKQILDSNLDSSTVNKFFCL